MSVSPPRNRSRKALIPGSFRYGETRTRTGDTTIFRQLHATLERPRKSCKDRASSNPGPEPRSPRVALNCPKCWTRDTARVRIARLRPHAGGGPSEAPRPTRESRRLHCSRSIRLELRSVVRSDCRVLGPRRARSRDEKQEQKDAATARRPECRVAWKASAAAWRMSPAPRRVKSVAGRRDVEADGCGHDEDGGAEFCD
jgi:hypothetical protein